jgi:hypothetical protein
MRTILDLYTKEHRERCLLGQIDNTPQNGNKIQSSKFPGVVFHVVKVVYIFEDAPESRYSLTAIVDAYDEDLLGS